MSGEVGTRETIYEAILLALREWKKRGNLPIVIQDEGHGLHLGKYLARLERENQAQYKILYQRFYVGKSAKEIRPRSPDAIYHKQRNGINLLASWVIEDKDTQRIASNRERLQMQRSMMPPPSYTKLIGMEQTVAQSCEHLVTNAPPHITLLTGIGGIGKTATTDAVVRRVIEQGEYEHIVWVRSLFLWLGFPFALGAAIYTAFLFAQAEGRDLWQSPLLPFHLVVQAFMMGGAMFLIVDLFMEMSASTVRIAAVTFVVSLIVDVFVTLTGEFGIPHASEVAAKAAHEISHGRYKNYFWGSLILGHLLPIVLMALGNVWLGAIAGLCAIVGLYLYEFAFVMAPQEIPNS